jgi:hypothetical protein
MNIFDKLDDREYASFLINNKCARIDGILEMTPLENQPKPGALITIFPGCRVTVKELLEASKNDPGTTECDWTREILKEEDLVQILSCKRPI